MKSLGKTEKEEFSVAMPYNLDSELYRHLIREDKQEDVAFALFKPSNGKKRFTSLIYKIILPQEGDRILHGNVDINPQYFKRVCKQAITENSGIALLHSHPSSGWQGMSIDDIVTENGYSSPNLELTNLPLVGLTLSKDRTWSARVWEFNNGWFSNKMASTVRIVGRRLEISHNDLLRPLTQFKEIYKRTISVWGKKNHDHLARMRVGIVGLGSVGSNVAETLARMGVERFVLIDFDEVQEHNLDRLLGATMSDIKHAKVYIAQRQIQKSATATNCEVLISRHGVTEEDGYYSALDCDVIFSCVDRPWPRHVLNHVAYNHLIPVIDGGIKVRFDRETSEFDGADWQQQIATPGRICLSCIGAYNVSDVSTEKEGLLDNPSYLEGLPSDNQFNSNENIFPFSTNLASLEVLQFIEMGTGIGCNGNNDAQRYCYNEGYIRLLSDLSCKSGCYFKEGIALGDSQFPPPFGVDYSALKAYQRQQDGLLQ